VLKEYSTAAEAFINLTTRLAASEKIGMTAEEYLAAGEKAREASFKLWSVGEEELNTLLQKRIDHEERKRAMSLIVSALALLSAVILVTFITRSISGPLRQQAAELTAANETLQAEMAERNRAEEELRRSESQLATAQIIARIGSWEWDVPSNKMIWSDENYRIHGFEPREFEVSYEATLQFIHPDERAISNLTIKRALQEGKPFSFEQRVLRPDGTERIIHQRGDVVPGPDGRGAKMFGTAQDVTERKQAEVELEKVHRQLLDTSRQAGMAEVATSVLHNVGNVLNSVNVSATVVADSLRKSRLPNLAKVTALMHERAADLGAFITSDPKGKQLPDYLGQLAEHLASEQETALKELELVEKNIEHIKDIVAMQQSFAKVSGLTEVVKVTDLVEDALRMNVSSLIRHDVQVLREYQAHVPEISVEKHKVLQILVNLVRNAKGACDESGRADKQVTLRVANGDGRIKIAVMDNGVGIPPENLTRIFNHGFTTKKDGHGFGLHSGALAAKEMGGSLNVHSDGPAKGAMFTLELPCQKG
jgi:PAS domain S-box-containing protein